MSFAETIDGWLDSLLCFFGVASRCEDVRARERARGEEREEPTNGEEIGLFTLLTAEQLPPEKRAELDGKFPDQWPPTSEDLKRVSKGHAVVFAARSVATEDHPQTTVELLAGAVEEVEPTAFVVVVQPPAAGGTSFACVKGHGLCPGSRVTVSHRETLVAGELDPSAPAAPAKVVKAINDGGPSETAAAVAVPYNLRLPYRPKQELWFVSPESGVEVRTRVGQLEEQVRLHGVLGTTITITLLDSAQGNVLVGKWVFRIAPPILSAMRVN